MFIILALAGCNNYKVEVDLTPERVQEFQSEIETLRDEIANFTSEDGSIAWRAIIDLASDYEKLGQLGEAIQVYEEGLDNGDKTKAILNNLGRLYEKIDQYEKAVAMYQRINDEYFDHDYLYDITWAYIRAKDRKNAEKYFNAWQLEFHKTDLQTQEAIKKLREEKKE